MLKQYHRLVGGAFRCTDTLVLCLSWVAAYYIRFRYFDVPKGFPEFESYLSLLPLIVTLWLVIFETSSVYSSARLLRRTQELQLLFRAHLSSLVAFIALTFLISDYQYSRGVLLIFGLLSGLSLLSLRLGLRNLLRWVRRKGYNLRHVLLIANSKLGDIICQKIQRFPELGLRVLGVLGPETQELIDNDHTKSRAPYLGSFLQPNLLQEVEKAHPDEILIALSRDEYPALESILKVLKDQTCSIQLIPDVHEYLTLGCAVEDFDGLPIVHLNDSPLGGWAALFKRYTDFLLSFCGLLVLSPLLGFIALLVKLSSRGPVFYRQERMGLDGKTFWMIKFRSMPIQIEAISGAVWAKSGDQRATPIGTLLRKTSLDELPQLWNVLKGEMALVGPRPERPIFVKQFRDEIPHYMLRHKVKSGMTGWAQIHGWRGNTCLSQRIEHDLYYIRHWSYSLDLKILWLTLFRGFIHKNAY